MVEKVCPATTNALLQATKRFDFMLPLLSSKQWLEDPLENGGWNNGRD
jgi:hypothetical protein